MTEEKNVGKMETWLIRAIGAIITAYFGSDIAGDAFGIPIMLSPNILWLLAVLIVAYFLNRIWIKMENLLDAWILIKQMQAEAERQVKLSEIQKADSKEIPVTDAGKPSTEVSIA